MLFKKPKTKEVVIAGVKFRIKRMNPDESFDCYKKLLTLPDEEQLVKVHIMTLSGALMDMNGIPIEDFYSGPEAIDDVVMRKYIELCTWDMPLLQILSKVYSDFIKEAEEEYTPSFLEKIKADVLAPDCSIIPLPVYSVVA